MNKMRRKELKDLIRDLQRVQDLDDISDAINTLDNLKYEEESYYDNIPDNLQSSERAEASEQAISCMENALDALNDIDEFDKDSDLIQQAIDYIDEAVSC